MEGVCRTAAGGRGRGGVDPMAEEEQAEEERGPDGGEGRANGVVPRRSGEGWADDTIPIFFNVEEERGADVEAHVEEGVWWRRTRRRSGRRRVCGGK
jgi:hypothetical protein